MLGGVLVEHDDVGAEVVERRHDLVDAVVAVEEIDGSDPETVGIGDRVGSIAGEGGGSGEDEDPDADRSADSGEQQTVLPHRDERKGYQDEGEVRGERQDDRHVAGRGPPEGLAQRNGADECDDRPPDQLQHPRP